jgi:hypothetical protein
MLTLGVLFSTLIAAVVAPVKAAAASRELPRNTPTANVGCSVYF